MQNTCSVDDCDRPVQILGRGLCRKCYNAQRLLDPSIGLCVTDACEKPAISLGFCGGCYMKQRRWGRVEDAPGRGRGPLRKSQHRKPWVNVGDCSVDGCSRPARAKTMCTVCYGRWYRYGDPTMTFRKANAAQPDGQELRRCRTCEEEKPLTEFYKRGDSGNHRTECRDCIKARAAASWEGLRFDPEHTLKRRDKAYREKYGISLAEYDRLYAEQGGRCYLCESPHDILSVDHNHETGIVRHLLCARCNTGLGWIETILGGDLSVVAAYIGETMPGQQSMFARRTRKPNAS